MKPLLAVAALALALVTTGCGSDEDSASPSPPPAAAPPASAGVPAPGGGLTVEEAIASTLDGPLLVRGYYVSDGSVVRLCSALAESHPPQCGGASLRLEPKLMLDADELETAEGVTWSEREVSLLGTVRDGVLTVSDTSVATG